MEDTFQIEGTLTKYISFWLTEDLISCDLVFVEATDGTTQIFP